jgi:UDP-glucose 4-epimerase
MDRVTASRNHRHVPNRVAHMAVEGVPCVRVNSLTAVGDYVHVEDVARAIVALLRAETLRYSTYNVAQGCVTTTAELVEWAAQKAPGFHAKLVAEADADILQDASLRDGMWGAYDISRITTETGWKPRPVREALQAYMQWIKAQQTR